VRQTHGWGEAEPDARGVRRGRRTLARADARGGGRRESASKKSTTKFCLHFILFRSRDNRIVSHLKAFQPLRSRSKIMLPVFNLSKSTELVLE
jgi:hypothetical protein